MVWKKFAHIMMAPPTDMGNGSGDEGFENNDAGFEDAPGDDGNADDESSDDGDDGSDDSDDGSDEGDGQGERLYAGMYKSVEELEAAHKSLQTQYQTTKGQAKDLLAQLQEIDSPAAQAPRGQTFNGVPLPDGVTPQMVQEAYKQDPMGTMQLINSYALQQQMAPTQNIVKNLALQNEILAARNAHSDFNQYESSIAEIIKQKPYLKDLPDKIEIAYSIAKASSVGKVTEKAYQNGVKDGVKGDAAKRLSSAMGGKGTGSANKQPKSAADEIGDSIVQSYGRRGIF